MKKHKWTIEEENWLTNNYKHLGPDKSAEILGLTKSQIIARTFKLKLKLPIEFKNLLQSIKPEKCNINPDLFYNISTKEISYLLGLIWADGFLNPSKNGKNSNLGFTMVKEDIDIIKPMLESIGKWNYYERKQPVESWKPSINVITNNKRILNFLIEHDYNKKSHISADKILSKIPDELKHYFFRGLIDGDGCFYYYKPENGSTLRQFALASTYEQDWSYFENLCKEKNIKYKIKRTIGKKSSSSVIRITNKDGIKNLGNFIYNNFENELIGLARKYNKFITIIQ
jgi:hypothetical protein